MSDKLCQPTLRSLCLANFVAKLWQCNLQITTIFIFFLIKRLNWLEDKLLFRLISFFENIN